MELILIVPLKTLLKKYIFLQYINILGLKNPILSTKKKKIQKKKKKKKNQKKKKKVID